jgi:hypothetical protein
LGAGIESSSKNRSDIFASKCWPVWIVISATPAVSARTRFTAAAFIN